QAHRREELLARAERLARERAGAGIPLSALAGALVPRPTGRCSGGDLQGFANGQLPEEALCPLWGTAGQVLRADAARAFDELSHAYAAETGEPVCVTDSYRSLPEQVAVRTAKPTLAAVPGTSNHGWGVALDLCGGMQQAGSPADRWMHEHAAASGWFHPAWAEPGGSKPEPWHWEFAG
ncbi:MAG: peptidase and DD-carboxypeptidase VanY/endolysin, partial [Frankiales bacterium]|nr:peptidase and DD-carboxypeptidase VanY/endolysin [Frankiales bacterium]